MQAHYLDEIALGMGVNPRSVVFPSLAGVRDAQLNGIGRAIESVLADPDPYGSLVTRAMRKVLGVTPGRLQRTHDMCAPEIGQAREVSARRTNR